jgi:hypothetical protein
MGFRRMNEEAQLSTPQQPELRRSGKGATDPRSAKAHVDGPPATEDATGSVPPDNQPGHHPEHEQDKPEGPPAA